MFVQSRYFGLMTHRDQEARWFHFSHERLSDGRRLVLFGVTFTVDFGWRRTSRLFEIIIGRFEFAIVSGRSGPAACVALFETR